MPQEPESPGLLDSARRLLATIVGAVHTRVELVSVEIEEQLHRAVELLAWSFLGIIAGGCGLLMLGLLVVVVFWEHRVLAGGIVTGAYLLTAVVSFLMVRAKARSRPRVLEGTLAELAKDRDALRPR